MKFETKCDFLRRFETFLRGIIFLHGRGVINKKEMKKCVSNNENSEELYKFCEVGLIGQLAEEYVKSCKEIEKNGEGEVAQKKKTSKFPNLAGFCRYLGISREKYERLSKKYPEEFGKLEAIFEDEALNSDVSASVITAYLKRRLGYNDSEKSEKTELETGQLRLIFEHDIIADGE